MINLKILLFLSSLVGHISPRNQVCLEHSDQQRDIRNENSQGCWTVNNNTLRMLRMLNQSDFRTRSSVLLDAQL